MSFLAEVLSTAETFQLEEINLQVPKLTSSVESMKSEVIQYVDKVYEKFRHRPKQNDVLLKKAEDLRAEILSLKKNAEDFTKKDLLKANNVFEKHTASLEKLQISSKIISHLCEVNGSLITFTGLLISKKYLQAMELITKTGDMLKSIPADERLYAVNVLENRVYIERDLLLNEVTTVCNNNIIITENDNLLVLKVKKQNDELNQALNALYYNNSVVYPLQRLTKFIWINVFTTIVDFVTKIKTSEENDYDVMAVVTVNTKTNAPYTEVFNNLKQAIHFLENNLNYQLLDDLSILGYIGRETRDNLSELLIKNCLQKTIPSNTEGLQKYQLVIENTEKFEQFLRECQIFTEDTTSILEYASNIDVLFINKKCKEYLQASEVIMKKDLHDMVEVGTPFDLKNPFSESNSVFSQCAVSKSAVELIQLAEKIMQQAVKSSDTASGRLFCTVQNIFQKYGTVVPEHHKKLLQTIPQQVALFYNNCMYLSNELDKWNEIYSSQLAPVLNAGPCVFKNEIFHLEHIGCKIFYNFVDEQIKQIVTIMKDAGLNGPSLDKIEPVTEKCIRQCIRQQELLKTVWHKVLSYNVYNKNLGLILDSFCSILINAIVKFEDISSDVAQQLVEILKVIFTRGPKLFTDPKEISLFVPSWYKFNELNFVLTSSLLDISNRWTDGKGPLGLQFKPKELKQLIRALFQNTDRRSALLSKIQD